MTECIAAESDCGQKAKDITPSIAWRREAWKLRRSARRSFLKRRERAIVNQTNMRIISKATLGEHLRDEVERIWDLPSA